MFPARTIIALCIIQFLPFAAAQTFGGPPPWGLEKPAQIHGEVRHGQRFERAIGDGLFLRLTPQDDDWEIEVGPAGSEEDYAACVTLPLHGPTPKEIAGWPGDNPAAPGAVGEKRWFEFVLNAQDQKTECHNLETERYAELGTHASGRCWLKVTATKLNTPAAGQDPIIESLTFDSECAPHGALELWRLPAVYVIPDDFSGWVTIYYLQKGAPELPKSGNRYTVNLGKSGAVRTASDLRQDDRGAQFLSMDDKPIPRTGVARRIWGWSAGAAGCSPFQSFFVGTGAAYKNFSGNPLLKNPTSDCATVIQIAR